MNEEVMKEEAMKNWYEDYMPWFESAERTVEQIQVSLDRLREGVETAKTIQKEECTDENWGELDEHAFGIETAFGYELGRLRNLLVSKFD